MARIILVVGLSSAQAGAVPEVVYLGRSGEAMRQAITNATHPRLIIVPHVTGIPKNNPRAAANAALGASVGEEPKSAPSESSDTSAKSETTPRRRK